MKQTSTRRQRDEKNVIMADLDYVHTALIKLDKRPYSPFSATAFLSKKKNLITN